MRVFRLRGDPDLCTTWSEGGDDARARLEALKRGDTHPSSLLPQPCGYGPGEPGHPWLLTDCPSGGLGQEGLVLSPVAQAILVDHLVAPPGALVPLLPSEPGTEGYALFMPRRVVEGAVDLSRSVLPYRQGASADLTRLFLLAEALPRNGVFKLPPAGGLFVTDAFADAVQAAGLTGFELTQMWNSEVGAIDLLRHTGPPSTASQILARVRGKLGALSPELRGTDPVDVDGYIAVLRSAPILPEELVVALTGQSAAAPAAAGRVVLFHRDWLNGGLAQACSNMRASLTAAVAAFGECVPGALAATVAGAARLASAQPGRDPWDAFVQARPEERAAWDRLDDQYRALAFDAAGRDVVEAKLLAFITDRPVIFGAALQAAFRTS